MSCYIEIQLAFDIVADAPGHFRPELEWHLGLNDRRPDALEMNFGSYPGLIFEKRPRLCGGRVAQITRPAVHNDDIRDSVFLRDLMNDDRYSEFFEAELQWMLKYARDGWIGYLRDEDDSRGPHFLYARDQIAFVGKPGEIPQASDPRYACRESREVPESALTWRLSPPE